MKKLMIIVFGLSGCVDKGAVEKAAIEEIYEAQAYRIIAAAWYQKQNHSTWLDSLDAVDAKMPEIKLWIKSNVHAQ